MQNRWVEYKYLLQKIGVHLNPEQKTPLNSSNSAEFK